MFSIAVLHVFVPMATAPPPNCAATIPSVCLAAAYKTLKNVTDPALCCKSCASDSDCRAWHVMIKRNDCFLHKSYQPNGRVTPSCVAGSFDPIPPAPAPSPAPTTDPLIGTDQRPQYHFQPLHNPTNDIQGPFYDPTHRRYHMGYAWHVLEVNQTHGGAPNRWAHIVSDDLAHWRVVSTTPDLAWLKPDMPYDQDAVMTGSTSIVNGTPMSVYSAKGNASNGFMVIATARPSNTSDPDLTRWTKSLNNPILTGEALNAQIFHDPTNVWFSRGMWRFGVRGCNRSHFETTSDRSLHLYSSKDLRHWSRTGPFVTLPQGTGIDCSDVFPVIMLEGSKRIGPEDMLYVFRYQANSYLVGHYDEDKQQLTDYQWPAQRLDHGEVSVGKSFHDPLHRQQVWTAWVPEGYKDCRKDCDFYQGCVNMSVCGTHTLPRSMTYDAELGMMVSEPVPQTELLRDKLLHHNNTRTVIRHADGLVRLPAASRGKKLEIRVVMSLPQSQSDRVIDQNSIGIGVSARLSATEDTHSTNATITCPMPAGSSCRLQVSTQRSAVTINKNGVHIASKTWRTDVPMKAHETNVTLRMFVDHSVVETFVQGGRAVITSRTYPPDEDDWVGLFVVGDDVTSVVLLEVSVWSVNTIWAVDNNK